MLAAEPRMWPGGRREAAGELPEATTWVTALRGKYCWDQGPFKLCLSFCTMLGGQQGGTEHLLVTAVAAAGCIPKRPGLV